MKLNIPKQLTNIRLENITRVSAILLRQGAIHAFEVSIILVMISVVLGALVYFKYKLAFPMEEREEILPPKVKSVRFQNDLYSKVLKKLEERQAEFQKAAGESYADPFYPEENLTEEKEEL